MSSATARRSIGETLLTASGVVILVVVLWATDERVRERASMLVAGGPPLVGAAQVGGRAGHVVGNAVHAARSWSGEHVYLTIFAVEGVVLLAAVRKL